MQVDDVLLKNATESYVSQHIRILEESVRLVLESKNKKTREDRYELVLQHFSALSKIRKYAHKNQKKRIVDAQDYFMIMNEHYKHPERIRKQEKQKLKRQKRDSFYETWNHQDSLLVYIAGSYDFHTAYIGNRRCIMLAPTEELATLPALKKQIVKIQQIDNVPVVFELTTVSNYRRKSLIENNIPFITDKQVFLPFIGTMLSDEKEPQKLTGKFVYSTQQLFLFYLYSKKKRLYTSEAGKVLPFTAMTLTRAVKQLETTDLFLVAKDGVNKFIESKYKRDELFEKAKVYLTTPVRKTGYIDKTQVTENMVFAGETALSEKTMLNPSRVVTYAISEKDYDKTLLTDELIDPDKQIRLELWAYNPKQFSEDNSADDISIVLSFTGTNDERIEEAVDELQERRLKE